jgi:hypothetical protein
VSVVGLSVVRPTFRDCRRDVASKHASLRALGRIGDRALLKGNDKQQKHQIISLFGTVVLHVYKYKKQLIPPMDLLRVSENSVNATNYNIYT